MEFWSSYSSEHLTAEPDISRNMFVGLYIYHILYDLIIRRLAKHIQNNSQSVRINFTALKNYIMLNVSLTKIEKNVLREFYHLFLKIMPK